MVLRKFSEITNNKPIVSTLFFTIMNIFFINLRFDLFSIITKVVNQIRNYVVWVVAGLVFLCTHYGPLQYFSTNFRKLKEIGVLRPIFPEYVISCDYGYIDDFWSTLIWVGYLGVRFEVGRLAGGILHVRTHIYEVSEYTPFSTNSLLILLMSAFFAKNQHFMAKIVPLLKAVVWELC